MKKRIIPVVILAVLIGLGYFFWDDLFPDEDETFKLYGNVDSRQIQIAFLLSERIADIQVEEGMIVKKGDYLASLEDVRLQNEYQSALAGIEIRQMAVEIGEINLRKVKNGQRPEVKAISKASSLAIDAKLKSIEREASRSEDMYKNNIVTKQTLDMQKDNVTLYKYINQAVQSISQLINSGQRQEDIDVAEANLKRAKAELNKAQLDLKILEQRLKDTKLYAPEDGVIQTRYHEPGEFVTLQSPVMSMSVVSPKWVRTYISETALMKIKVGNAAVLHFDGCLEEFHGKVGFISSNAEFTPKNIQTEELRSNLVYEVKIFVDDPENQLKTGAPVTITFSDII